MSWLSRFTNVLRGARVDRELEEEHRFHLEARIEQLVHQGMSRADAEREASRRFGHRVLWREQSRDIKLFPGLADLSQDIRIGLRLLRCEPIYSAAVVLTLALCLAANAAIFTVVRSVLLRPLPYPDAERLVFAYDSFPGAGIERAGTSVPNYFDRAALPQTFLSVALYRARDMDVGDAGSVERLAVQQVTPSFFTVLGVPPLLGRVFIEDEGHLGKTSVVVLSHAYWMRQFNGSSAAIGQSIPLNGVPYTVVGVMPRAFTFLDPSVRLWIPAAFRAEERGEEGRHSQNHHFIARLADGVTVARVQSQVDALNAAYLERAGAMRQTLLNTGYRSIVVPLEADIVRNVRAALRLLWAAALLVLLIAGVNIANLALARTGRRLKELATRHAIGASRARLLRQLLTETLLQTLAGGALGLGAAWWSLAALSWLGVEDLPRAHEIRLDGVVIAVTLGQAALLGVAMAAAPALRLAGFEVGVLLKEDGRATTVGRGARCARWTLATVQVALAFVLLVGAGLLLISFNRVLQIDPGFRQAHVLSGRINMPTSRYADAAALRAFADRVLGRIRVLPGVEAAGGSSDLPLTGSTVRNPIFAEGHQRAPGESVVSPHRLQVTVGYLEAMNVALQRGRFFTDADTADAPRVVIVDEALARRFWPMGDPIGRRMYLPQRPEDILKPGPDVTRVQVVGVVGAVRLQGLIQGEDDRVGAYYFPYAQSPSRSIGLAIRATGDLAALTATLRRTLADIDPQLALYDVRSMTERVERSLDRRRTPMLISVAFAGIGLLLAAIGIYGVLAYQVSLRTREIGIRMALGSDARGVIRLILTEAVVLIGAGLIAGLAGSAALRGVIASELYAVSPLDPIIVSSVAIVVGLTAVVACIGPTRHAMRVSPAIALSK
jgi:predicted permease